MSTPFEISDDFTERWADLSPLMATKLGVTGREGLCTDFSPDGEAARHDLYSSTRTLLEPHLAHTDPDQAFAAKVLVGWLDEAISNYENDRWTWDLNHIHSPFQWMRDVFDVMPRASAEDWGDVRARLDGMDGMIEGYRSSLEEGMAGGRTAAKRQVGSLIDQVRASAGSESRFLRFVEEAAEVGIDPEPVSASVDRARAACDDFAAWLTETYLTAARDEDAVGEELYLEGADRFLGVSLDPHETYQWGWEEVHRIRAEMKMSAAEVDPDATVEEVIRLLDTDPNRSAGSRKEFVDFISSLQQRAIEQLSGDHFDVPEELRTVTVNIAPPGGSLGAWYVGPSEDFSRPGSIWYAPGQRERLPYWQEVSTAYHEGFPGHHLQVGTAILQRDRLSRFHRAVIWYPGSGEGWALYAERIMDELGFFTRPEYRLGLLASQLFRSVRVVLDIGCQLQKSLPDDAPLFPGETWSYDIAVDYMDRIALQARDVAESEVKRYLGWWGQAISYKVGEREILDIRGENRDREGDSFDLRDFHRRLLGAGAIRLDHLRTAMS